MLDNTDIQSDVYIGRQPIIDTQNSVVAYEILYRSTSGKNYCEEDHNDFDITSQVISAILNDIGIEKLIGDKRGLINVSATMLNSEIIKNIPKDKFSLEILETVDINENVISKIDEMIKDGYSFVLDDFDLNEENLKKYKPIFPRVKYIKADLKENSMDEMQKIIENLKDTNINFLAEKVETHEEYIKLKEMGYQLFQGYFFSKPVILRAKKVDPSKSEILNLLSIIQNSNDLNTVVNSFEDYPAVSIKLLKFLNSSFFSFKQNISSIKQSITLLGLDKLKNWLTLLLYTSEGKDPYSNPLFIMIKNRSIFMSTILKYIKQDSEQNREIIHLTGLLSKIDVIMQTHLEEALDSMNIDEKIKRAIIDKEGLAGEILSLAEANELNDTNKINQFVEKYSLSMKHLTSANLLSYSSNVF